MTCPKCQCANPETAQFCVRCHATLHFTCPSCKHTQNQCGVDLVKFAAMREFQMETQTRQQRETAKTRHDLIKQALLLPVTGGWSLLRYMRSAVRGD
jgi:hypothetical protein